MLSTSTLWSDFHMHLRRGRTIQDSLFAEMWLNRAKSQPLSILLSHEPSGTVELKAIRNILEPHFSTIRKLQLRAPDTVVQTLFCDVSRTMSLLEVLHLDITHESLDSESLGFLNAPLLHTALVHRSESIFQSRLYLKALEFIPPHDQMRSLHLNEISLSSGLLEKIKGYRELEECDLSFSDGGGNILSSDCIVIPKLRTLRLQSTREMEPSSIPKLLARITLPALTRLDITHAFCSSWTRSDEPAAWLQVELVQFLERSQSNLETLTLDLSEYELYDHDPQELVVLLRAVSSLVRLDIDVNKSTDLSQVFAFMTASTDNSEPLLPCLKQFRVGRLSKADTESMARMVRSRWWSDSNVASRNGVSRLSLVTLLDVPDQSLSSFRAIERLRKRAARYEGIDFFDSRWSDKICT